MNPTISKHPILQYANDISDICKPLEKFGITYFAHVNIDNNKQFSAISSSPGFSEHYLRNKYYNADIHMANSHQISQFVIWDAIERRGMSEKMHLEAASFGVQHTFTIIEKSSQGTDYYHFANNSSCKSINQVYICNIDMLQLFISHFKEQIALSSELTSAYDLKFAIDDDAEGYIIKSQSNITDINIARADFMNLINKPLQSKNVINQYNFNNMIKILTKIAYKPLSKRETECLYLTIQGKSAKQIAAILKLSTWTIEEYLQELKIKCNVSSKSELIGKTMRLFNISI